MAGTSLAVRVSINTGDQKLPSLGSPTEQECGQCLVQYLAQCSAIWLCSRSTPSPDTPAEVECI